MTQHYNTMARVQEAVSVSVFMVVFSNWDRNRVWAHLPVQETFSFENSLKLRPKHWNHVKWERFLNLQMDSYSISVSVWDHYHGYWDWDRFLNPGPGRWSATINNKINIILWAETSVRTNHLESGRDRIRCKRNVIYTSAIRLTWK